MLATAIPRAIMQPPRPARWASLKSSRNGPLWGYLSECDLPAVQKTQLEMTIRDTVDSAAKFIAVASVPGPAKRGSASGVIAMLNADSRLSSLSSAVGV